jgi:hypothetical protein
MKLFAVILSALLAGVICSAQAQPSGSGTSPNLIFNLPPGSTSNVTTGWTGTTPYTGTGGGLSGGSQPGFNSSTNTLYFGYNQSVAAYTYAFSQALQNSGMSITGYNYGWEYINEGLTGGNLSAKVNFAAIDGTSLHTKTWTLGPTSGWTSVNGTENFINGLPASNISNFSLSFSGKDSRFWAGYYGPQVRNPSLSLNYTFDTCVSNPLSSPSCPGYAVAYQTQQCTANALYSPDCPGYAVAYQTQQCTINPLSSPSCPGYASAYLTQQCSLDPLYSTTCQGYDQAYFKQQCSINPLYDSRCTGYAEALAAQQCTINPLSSTTCSGYASAYFDQQCTLNALYDTKCPNYAVAYAKKMVLEQQGIAGTVALAGTVAATAPTTTATVDSTTGTVSTSTTGNTTVDKALPPPATSANSAAAPAAPVQLVQQPPPPTAPQQGQQDKKPDGPKPEGGPQGQPPQGGPQGGDKPQPTARQALAERRQEAAKRDAVEKGKNLAKDMGKATDLEAQKQVQNVVIQAMGFTPGFDNYGKTFMPDAVGYKPFTVYNNQKTVDNRRLGLGLFGPTDRLHSEMVDLQYKE